MVRALIVDDHPAVLSGLVSAFRSEPGLVPLGTATGLSAAVQQAELRGPNVALVDYHLADGDGLVLCHRLKCLASPPAVLMYSASVRQELAVAARVAGADGMIDKGAPLDDLFAAIRTVYRGGKALPALRPAVVERVVTRLDPDDLPILGMSVDGVTLPEIATVLHLDEDELSRRVVAMLGQLMTPAAPAGNSR